jgi:peptidyl-prolyl cis-trans isomerase SurA
MGATAQQLDATVATVKLTKPQPILLSNFSREVSGYQKALAQQGRALTDDDRTAILFQMIDVILFRQAAERDHVTVSDAQMNALLERTRQTVSVQQGRDLTMDDLKAFVVATGQTWDYWLQSQRDQVLVQLFVSQTRSKELQNIPAPSAADVDYYYQTNTAQFALGELVEFKHIFVSLQGKDASGQKDAKARIDGLLQRISEGESFEDVASVASEDGATKANGGYAGFLQLDQPQAKALGKEFIQGLLQLKEGQISRVLRSAAGYHIVKVVRIIPARLYALGDKLPPYYQQTVMDSVRALLVNQNQQQALASAIQATAADLRRQAAVTINEQNLGFKLTRTLT